VEANYVNHKLLGVNFEIRKPINLPTGNIETDPTLKNLFEYQKQDVLRMVSQREIFNANRMGYGKTVETIGALKLLKYRKILVVAPKSVLLQWKNEFAQWWPEATTTTSRPRRDDLQDSVNVLGYITNFESFQNRQTIELCKSISWDAVVIDESHKIKNRKSKRWQHMIEIPGTHRILLSGTPILRRVDDLWAQLFWLNWRFSGISYWNFVDYFCETRDGPFGKEIGALTKDETKVSILNDLVNTVCVRNDDLNLTKGKHIHTVTLEMEPSQQKLYKQAKDLVFNELPEKLTIATGMTHMLRLRQLTSSPEQFEPTSTNAKFDWIEDTLEGNPTTKFVIFSNWATTLKRLQTRLGSKAALWIGNISPGEREYVKDRFVNDPSCQVLLGTIAAIGTGVDGLQHGSSTAIFIDKDWSPEINAQAEDRLNRLGQKQSVQIYYLECRSTMDKYVSKLNLSKAEDIRKALMDEGE
jgi:SNF2 family DNA or RNA helicase